MPCLDAAIFEGFLAEAHPWLAALDEDPSQLVEHIKNTPRHNRLGLYYEALLSFWFENNAPWELLAHELPVYDGKRTLGAFDFLLGTEQGVVHVEVAIKYYLGVDGGLVGGVDAGLDTGADWFDWIGPRQKDSLGRKLNKMLDKQLLLSEHPCGQEALAKAGIPKPVDKKLWFKGIYFRPHDSDPQCKPDQATTAAGIWIPISKLHDFQATTPQALWLPRIKPDWLAQLFFTTPPEHTVSGAQLTARAQAQWPASDPQPLMWSRLEKEGDFWLESLRVFVVPDDWLERAQNLSHGPVKSA